MPKTPKTVKRRRRKPSVPTSRQEVFIKLCAAHGNRTRAYVEAGYRSKYPAQHAYQLASQRYISDRIREAIEAQVGGKPGLTSRLAQHADANLKDFEPWLHGRKSLRRLAREGVNVAVVKSATIRTSDEGETRRIELYDAQEATWKLIRMAGYGHGGTDPDAPKPAQVAVQVDFGKIFGRRLAEVAGEPSAPGLAPDARFAGRSALLTEHTKAGTGNGERGTGKEPEEELKKVQSSKFQVQSSRRT